MTLVIPPLGVTPLSDFNDRRSYQLQPPPVIRADRIDPGTQEWTSFINDLDPVDGQVVEAVWRVRGSGAAVQSTGVRFLDEDKILSSTPAAIESECRAGLRRLVTNGDIFIKSLAVITGPDWAEIQLDYINLRAAVQKKERQVRRRVPEGVNDGQT